MNDLKIRKLVWTALLAALTCVATLVIQIPSPANGYINLGDCFVLLSAWLLGPWCGSAAAGIGSMLADLLAGYAYYAPGTLVVKALMALVAAVLYRKNSKNSVAAMAFSAVVAEVIMVAGYFLYAMLLLGKGIGAAASIPGNLIQGAVGAVVSIVLMGLFQKAKLDQKLI
jgi:ECF transporter S component (folate family)